MRSAIHHCEALIRQGQIPLATRQFRSIPMRKIAAEQRLPLATLARRLGLLRAGFTLLKKPVSPRERAEYAVLLVQNGNVQEAMNLLESLDGSEHPDVLLAKAWCAFEAWDYEGALPFLKSYERKQRDPYWNLAGRINLGEALLEVGEVVEAIEVLSRSVEEAARRKHLRLLANALHFRARAHFALGHLTKSDDDLAWAMRLYGKRDASDALLIRRQGAINAAFRARDPAILRRFREEARRSQAWESVRECEFQLLKLEFNATRFARLYFGTPFGGYRRRLEREFPSAQVPNGFLWGESGGAQLDLSRETRITRQNRALLAILLGDFYRPLRVGEIFSSLFPQHRFDLEASPLRVHQALRRLRAWLAESRLPLELVCESRSYSLRRTGAVAVRVPRELLRSPGARSAWGELEPLVRRLPGGFSVSDVRESLRVSKATATRKLSSAVAAGVLAKVGAGPATRYRAL